MSIPVSSPSNGRTADASASAPSPEASRQRGLDGDLERLVEAASGLVEAAARPVANALGVIGRNVGSEQGVPRVRLHALEQTSTELVSAAIRLFENVASLSLQAIGATPAPARAGAVAGLPSVKAGEQLRLPMSVENPTAAPMTELRFQSSALLGPEQHPIPAAAVRVEPDVLTIAPRDFEKLVVHVAVPAGTPPGTYAGRLDLAGNAGFTVPIRFQVG